MPPYMVMLVCGPLAPFAGDGPPESVGRWAAQKAPATPAQATATPASHIHGHAPSAVARLLVIPVIGQLVPYDWATDVLSYLPGSAGEALFSTTGDASMSVGVAFITLVGWMAASIAVATVLLRRRDV